MSIEGQGHFLTMALGRVHTKIQTVGFTTDFRVELQSYMVKTLRKSSTPEQAD